MKEVGYTFFWKGKDSNESRIHGVDLVTKTEPVKKHKLNSMSTSECLISIQMPLLNKIYLTLVSVYVPILDPDDEIKNAFYDSPIATFWAVPRN